MPAFPVPWRLLSGRCAAPHGARDPIRPGIAPFGAAAAAAMLLGVASAARWPEPLGWAAIAIAMLAGLALSWRGGIGRLLGIAALGFGLTMAQATWRLAHQLPAAYERQDIVLSGRVIDLPDHDVRVTRYRFRVDDEAGQPAALRGRELRLSWYDDGKSAVSRRHEVGAGSRWRFHLRLRAPRGLRNPGTFDSERGALAQGIAATGYVRDPPQARRLAAGAGLQAWRDRMSRRIAADVRSPAAKYVRALALGDTRGLDDADWETLRADGLTHLIAISGFHVGMVASLFGWLASCLWRRSPWLCARVPRPQAAGIAALGGAFAYALVSGFGLPTARTVLMIAIVVAARVLRRPMRVSDALGLAALAMLATAPLAVLTAGFWLSFAGVAWLAWCLPDGTRHPVGAFLSAQGVATLGLLPLTVVLFGQASLAGPLANLLAIPWWSLVVVPSSLIGTALEAAHAGAGAWAWRVSAWCFERPWPWLQWLAHGRFALWWLPEPRAYALPLALAGAFWCLLPRGVPGKALAALLWLPLLWPDRALPAPGAAELQVLDVGQGLSVLVRTAHHSLVYDMGPAQPDGFDAGDRVVVPSLRALGVRGLDAAVISHGDNDHAGGFPSLWRQMPMPVAFAPDGVKIPMGPRAAGFAKTRPCLAGTAWRWDGVVFRFLHPPRYFPYLDNESSCVLRIETRHGAALLLGDIGEVIERDLLRRDAAALRADVVLAAHHGSGESSDPAFVAATRAKYALISAGYGNRYHHPNADAVARWRRAGARVVATLDGGALRIRLDAGGPHVELRRRSQPHLWDAARRQRAGEGATLSYRSD
jgi:competence protein ComEC